MKIFIYLIIEIICSITTILPLSFNAHLTILQNLINTKIFNYSELNSIAIIPSTIAIFLIILKFYKKPITKYINKKNFKTIILLSIPILINLVINFYNKFITLTLKTIPLLFLITALLLFLTKNKTNTKRLSTINFKNIIFLSFINLLTIIKEMPIFIINLLGCYICKLDKESSIKYTFTIYFFNLLPTTLKSIQYIFISNNPLSLTISIFISTIVSLSLIKYLTRLIQNNKLSNLSLYLIIIAIITIYWFR